MSPKPEELLQEAVQMHQSSKFEKGFKLAEKARKTFLKDKRPDRAIEALRVMADCVINQRNLEKAKQLYEQLLQEAKSLANKWYESAASWGLGQVAAHKMDYKSASEWFEKGLSLAESIADQWYTAWNAFGLGNSLRGLGQLAEARSNLDQALSSFQAQNQKTLASWVQRVYSELVGELQLGEQREAKIWLCPMCGSKYSPQVAASLRSGKMVTCEYCGTSVG
jgi:tetratricopeptide (TPR) repeat protein